MVTKCIDIDALRYLILLFGLWSSMSFHLATYIYVAVHKYFQRQFLYSLACSGKIHQAAIIAGKYWATFCPGPVSVRTDQNGENFYQVIIDLPLLFTPCQCPFPQTNRCPKINTLWPAFNTTVDGGGLNAAAELGVCSFVGGSKRLQFSSIDCNQQEKVEGARGSF